MGARIPLSELKLRAEKFFLNVVVPVLVERNLVRGDSYLEMDLDDFATMFRDKGGRIKTAAGQDLSKEAVRREIADSVRDEGGYAALCWIWLEEHGLLEGIEGEFNAGGD